LSRLPLVVLFAGVTGGTTIRSGATVVSTAPATTATTATRSPATASTVAPADTTTTASVVSGAPSAAQGDVTYLITSVKCAIIRDQRMIRTRTATGLYSVVDCTT
jgi:hypothetical protein